MTSPKNDVPLSQESLFDSVLKDLQKHANPTFQKSMQRFFLEPINAYGIPKPAVRLLAKKYYEPLKLLKKEEVFLVIDQLLQLHTLEANAVAVLFALRLHKKFVPADFERLDVWVKRYLITWADCDDFCAGPLKMLLSKYPELIVRTASWVQSPRAMVRRAAVVCLIYVPPTKELLPIIFERVLSLAQDADVLVLKGCGWLLKKVSAKYPTEVIGFLKQNSTQIPSVIRIYALEKMSAEQKNMVKTVSE